MLATSRAALACSCYEIYGGKVFDLLNGRKKLEVREDGRRRVQVVGLREVAVGSLEVLRQLCDHSAAARSTGSTGANDESSR
jgi:kinesin family protein 2/24